MTPAAPIRRRHKTPSVFTLTTGPDTFVGGPEDDTVNGTAATLNAGDRLTGGAVTMCWRSTGAAPSTSISWRSSRGLRASRSTISRTALPSLSRQPADCSDGIWVRARTNIYLGSGAASFTVAAATTIYISTSASNWNAGNVIDGRRQIRILDLNSGGFCERDLRSDDEHADPHRFLYGYGYKPDAEDQQCRCHGVANFYWLGTNGQTGHIRRDARPVAQLGERFHGREHQRERHDISPCRIRHRFPDRRRAGQDTIVANGFAFSADQRNAIFATASIETIVDPQRTPTAAPAPTPHHFSRLTSWCGHLCGWSGETIRERDGGDAECGG